MSDCADCGRFLAQQDVQSVLRCVFELHVAPGGIAQCHSAANDDTRKKSRTPILQAPAKTRTPLWGDSGSKARLNSDADGDPSPEQPGGDRAESLQKQKGGEDDAAAPQTWRGVGEFKVGRQDSVRLFDCFMPRYCGCLLKALHHTWKARVAFSSCLPSSCLPIFCRQPQYEHTQIRTSLVLQGDWGELNTGKQPPTLFVLDLATWRLVPVGGLPADSSVGHPIWTSKGED